MTRGQHTGSCIHTDKHTCTRHTHIHTIGATVHVVHLLFIVLFSKHRQPACPPAAITRDHRQPALCRHNRLTGRDIDALSAAMVL